jgi:hypothetical protein
MRKIILILVLFAITTVVLAGSGKIKVISGSKDILNENAKIVLAIDYSDALWENGSSYERFSGDEYQERIEGAYNRFVRDFNMYSNGLQITKNDQNAKYLMTIKVANFLRKLRIFYRGEVMIWCTIIITDIATGEECLKIKVEKSGGANDYSTTDGIYKCFGSLAQKIARIL